MYGSARTPRPGKKKARPTDKRIQSRKPKQKDKAVDSSLALRDNKLLPEEDIEDIVRQIMDELLSNVERCYEAEMKRKVIPYTVCWAKNYLINSVESQIQHLDEGETPEELCETEDCEPLPAIPDCCAQRCVPIIYVGTYFTSQQVSTNQKEPGKVINDKVPAQTEPDHGTCPPATPHPKKTPQVKKGPKYSPRKQLTKAVSSTEKMDVGGEDKNRESVACKEETAPRYPPKEPQPIPKLDPRSLPRHRTVLQWEVLDDDPSKPRPRKTGPKSNK
ncbi:uncharacterized protein C2orf81 homolog [Cyprinodon tularosa]|uniref:uncharacterized protein C2orf81 homolog n=1 Tax=Cyprinodon tularosa TaxID=77115 RepID=UPI0018E25143|nr:uncharacterized protein C2orf81 homolog [Cyprinodon tularosa]XP_038125725.1 uncharacterized protein C2orf81 homolog [Cyprinodon tularosa]